MIHPTNKLERNKVKLAHSVKAKEHAEARAFRYKRRLQEEQETEDELRDYSKDRV